MNEEIYQKEALQISKKAKEASRFLRFLSTNQKNEILLSVKGKLLAQKEAIIAENEKDLQLAREKKISPALLDRLAISEKTISSMAKSLEEIANLPDPVGEVTRGLDLPNGLQLATKRVPIGVIMTIYESRPNVTIDVSALSFKSGNSCILRGGSEAFHSNTILSSIFRSTLLEFKVPQDAVTFLPFAERKAMVPFLKMHQWIDLVVPRGGEALIQFVSESSSIPVVKHDKGVTNLFVDKSADPSKVVPILLNSKTQRPAVCNALENLFVHKDYPFRKELYESLLAKGVQLFVEEKDLTTCSGLQPVKEEMFFEEFLDLRLSAKVVPDIETALSEIRRYSSGHTECILSEDFSSIQKFEQELDSAAIFVNCSTRFHDGGEFQLGAEVGISTGKLHVRGPMGLVHLTTTTTFLRGNGQIRS